MEALVGGIVGLVAAVIGIVSLVLARAQVKEAKRQTELQRGQTDLQREIAEQAAHLQRGQTEQQREIAEQAADLQRRQTELQREIAEQAAQPYVWADVKLQEANGFILELVVGNSGPTVATDIRISIEPPFPQSDGGIESVVYEKLRKGLSSLAPGRTLHWSLGGSPDVLKNADNKTHAVTIDAQGPFSAVPRSEFIIDMNDWNESVAKHEGTLHEIAKAVTELDKHLPVSGRALNVRTHDAD